MAYHKAQNCLHGPLLVGANSTLEKNIFYKGLNFLICTRIGSGPLVCNEV